jgi:polyhydroxyalkanoate synthesis repressor PhaR
MTTHQNAPVVVKKYANRRLYNTSTSSYVTLDDLSKMVKRGEDFAVSDAKTGEDITRSVLTQIIFDAEAKGQNLLPITFLRQLIRLYDDSIQHLVPPYLEHTLAAFSTNREKLLPFGGAKLGSAAIEAIEEQARRNMELFQKSMRMFIPIAGGQEAADDAKTAAPARPSTASPPKPPAPPADLPTRSDFEEMRAQLMAMQKRIDQLTTERRAAPGDGEPQQPHLAVAAEEGAPYQGAGPSSDTAASGEEAPSEPEPSRRDV